MHQIAQMMSELSRRRIQYIADSMQPYEFCFFLLSIMHLKFIHIVACVSSSFLLVTNIPFCGCTKIYQLAS